MTLEWLVKRAFGDGETVSAERIVEQLLLDRGIATPAKIRAFLNPEFPHSLSASDVGIDADALAAAVRRIKKAVKDRESVVVYADYDADGITAGAVMWETLWKAGARVMPYIPHRVDEGYGLSVKGIDTVREQFDPSLIITVDHGITARENVGYAKQLGIDVIVTDHHVMPDRLPETLIVHTTALSGSGVSWFVAKTLLGEFGLAGSLEDELTALASIGTVADLLPLTGVNRSIVKHGLDVIRRTKRTGLDALIEQAGLEKSAVDTYSVSHVLAPRLNAMGRLEHAIDALRLLCTPDSAKARLLAEKLGVTNKERQQLTVDTVMHAKGLVPKTLKEIIVIAHESYNPGVIGLVAGRLVEEYWRPSVVLAIGDGQAKASARSIPGFNIVEAIRSAGDLLVDVGGHPMAAGFTVEVKNIAALTEKLERVAAQTVTGDMLRRVLAVDAELPLSSVTETLWKATRQLAPFGFGNAEPVFAARDVTVSDARLIGATRKHVKFRVHAKGVREPIDAIAFNMADSYPRLMTGSVIDCAFTVDMNEWNGRRNLQLKIKDIAVPHEKTPHS